MSDTDILFCVGCSRMSDHVDRVPRGKSLRSTFEILISNVEPKRCSSLTRRMKPTFAKKRLQLKWKKKKTTSILFWKYNFRLQQDLLSLLTDVCLVSKNKPKTAVEILELVSVNDVDDWHSEVTVNADHKVIVFGSITIASINDQKYTYCTELSFFYRINPLTLTTALPVIEKNDLECSHQLKTGREKGLMPSHWLNNGRAKWLNDESPVERW